MTDREDPGDRIGSQTFHLEPRSLGLLVMHPDGMVTTQAVTCNTDT